jgi:hypothetical protein
MTNMSDNLCSRLDEYLDGGLSWRGHAEFVSHLVDCAACREAVDEQQWIDALLRSDKAAALEAPPGPASIPIRGKYRRRVLAAAVAAAILAAVGAPLFPRPRRDGLGEGRATVASQESTESSDRIAATGSPKPQATVRNPSPNSALPGSGNSAAAFISSGSTIAVPVASEHPQVTIVKLYPTVTASRRWAREAALRASALRPNGG